MIRAQNPNIRILELAVERLGSLANDMVFLGGCATGLLITDPAAPPIRATQDVDVITEVASLAAYHRLSQRLREQGFAEDQSPDAPICRWVSAGVVLAVPGHLQGGAASPDRTPLVLEIVERIASKRNPPISHAAALDAPGRD
jgi:hypothetical protein